MNQRQSWKDLEKFQRNLMRWAWILYGISMALPVIYWDDTPIFGVQAFMSSIYVFLLDLENLLFHAWICSANVLFFYFGLFRSACTLWRGALLIPLNLSSVFYWPVTGVIEQKQPLGPGYWMWALSHCCMAGALGLGIRRNHLSSHTAGSHTLSGG